MTRPATRSGFLTRNTGLHAAAARIAALVLTLGLAAGCSSTQNGGSFFGGSGASNDTSLQASTNPSALDVYRIKPGDQLSINVLGYGDLSGNFPVSETGQMNLPQVGPVMAANKSVDELQNELVARYAATGAVQDPKILVSVLGPQ